MANMLLYLLENPTESGEKLQNQGPEWEKGRQKVSAWDPWHHHRDASILVFPPWFFLSVAVLALPPRGQQKRPCTQTSTVSSPMTRPVR